MDILVYAALMGFIFAAPFGAVGAACALASMQHRLNDALRLTAGVVTGDAVLIIAVNAVILWLPAITWADIRSLGWVWWPLVVALGLYGAFMVSGAINAKLAQAVIRPKYPFWQAVGWTLIANPKNWLGTFAAYAAWQVAGLLESATVQIQVGLAAWLGGIVGWLVWIALCWQATKWQYRAEQVAQRLIGALCLIAAISSAITLLQ